MHILLLTQILPYPPDAGPKVKTWHVLRYLLGCGHQVTLVSYVRKDEYQHIPEIERLGVKFHAVPIQRSRARDLFYFARSLISGRPFLIERDDLPELRGLLKKLLDHNHYDVIHADQLTMTQFAESKPTVKHQPARVFDAHNATWSIFGRMQENASILMKPLISLETKRLKKYEAGVIRDFDYTMVVTDIDRELMLQALPKQADRTLINAKIKTIPIAVDTKLLQPTVLEPGAKNIVTLGTLHYPPNADGIRWFMEKVYPLVKKSVPGITLTVIGKNPPEDFLQAARNDVSITITGYVPELEPYLQKAALMVVPVRAGSGMRVRILEALSRAIPVVTTTIGLEGIDAKAGSEVLVGDTPEEFAYQVCRLLEDDSLRRGLSANGRRLAETRYDWQIILRSLDQLYCEISSNGK